MLFGVRRGQFAGYEGPEEDAARLAFSVELCKKFIQTNLWRDVLLQIFEAGEKLPLPC